MVVSADPGRATSTGSGQVVLTLDEAGLERLADLVAQRLVRTLTTSSTDDQWLDAKAAAQYLGFTSPSPLHKLTAQRAISFSQDATGGKCWFRRSDLDAYRLQGRVQARDARG